MNKIVFKDGGNPYGNDQVRSNIEYCLKFNLPELFEIPAHCGELIIAGGAPSIKNHLETLSKRKSPIWAINGAVKYLVKNGIEPKAMVILDSADGVADMMPDEDIDFLIASQSSPKVFDKAVGRKSKVWHASVEADEHSIISQHRENYMLIGGGCSTLLRSIILGYSQGYRQFHIFGFDCSFGKDTHVYANEYTDERAIIDVYFNNQKFTTTFPFARQAQELVDTVNFFINGASDGVLDSIDITIYGEGLAQSIAKSIGLEVVI